ncbi:ethanolamine utilization protein EutJ [Pseudonocardia endophytica]|uniref:Ethanolamine utilization protein EutJ n=1 Tax=Pseudonocardia endophytica TaxID=401976 RepID=A0A4R1HG48_PSEEN|nr:ethanolamine utilization protein EutJ [Pseudonocardia endophytica]
MIAGSAPEPDRSGPGDRRTDDHRGNGRPGALLDAAAALLAGSRAPDVPVRTPVRVGVDLGTANCVLVVLDAAGEPVWVDAHPSGALADGVVVDFAKAIATVRGLKQRAERALGVELTAAATAYPPCIPVADARACAYVCEAAGFDDVALVDEVSAAQAVLGIDDGVVVDVGGGSTGVGVFAGGELVALDDRAGGGHHLDLVLAGALGIGIAEAEPRKRSHPGECLPILTPGLHRIAESVRAMTTGRPDLPLHLAGGALMLPGADRVLQSYLERPVVTYPHALLITPLGIAAEAPEAAA